MKKITVKMDKKLSKALKPKSTLDVTVYQYLRKNGSKSQSQLEKELNVIHATMQSVIQRLLVKSQIESFTCECCNTTKLFRVTNIL